MILSFKIKLEVTYFLHKLTAFFFSHPHINDQVTSGLQTLVLPKQEKILIVILNTFMDGSKDNGRAACKAVLNKTVLKKALPRESSIFTAEAHAIDLALNIISKSKHKKFIIFSDSLSVLL